MRKHNVFCEGCAHLFIVKDLAPMCVALAKFVKGPLRQKIDVLHVTSAESRNIKNNCGYKSGVSIQAWEFKRWLLRRFNYDDKKRFEEINLREYSVKEEYDRKRAILDDQSRVFEEETEQEKSSTEKITGGDFIPEGGNKEDGKKAGYDAGFDEKEDLRADGGADDHDKSGTSGEVGSEDVQDS